MSVVVGRRGGLRGEVVGRLAQLGGLHAEAELTGPRDAAHVVGIARWRGGSNPLGRLVSDEVEVGPVLPRHPLRQAVVADAKPVLGVDRVASGGGDELEQIRQSGTRKGRDRASSYVLGSGVA